MHKSHPESLRALDRRLRSVQRDHGSVLELDSLRSHIRELLGQAADTSASE